MELHRTWTSLAGAGAIGYFGVWKNFQLGSELRADADGKVRQVWDSLHPGEEPTARALSELENAIHGIRGDLYAEDHAEIDRIVAELGFAPSAETATTDSIIEQLNNQADTAETFVFSLGLLTAALAISGIAGGFIPSTYKARRQGRDGMY